MTDTAADMDEAVAEDTGPGTFQTSIRTAGTQITADEPVSAGGLGSGPTPYQLLASALAACTTMTLRLYANGKNWPVTRIRTAVGHLREPGSSPADLFTRRIEIEGDVTEEQRARMLEIADKCPVHRTLGSGARIETRAGSSRPPARPATGHMVDMEALIAVGRGSYDFAG